MTFYISIPSPGDPSEVPGTSEMAMHLGNGLWLPKIPGSLTERSHRKLPTAAALVVTGLHVAILLNISKKIAKLRAWLSNPMHERFSLLPLRPGPFLGGSDEVKKDPGNRNY